MTRLRAGSAATASLKPAAPFVRRMAARPAPKESLMESTKRPLPVRLVSGFWLGLDWSRRVVVNLLFLAIVLFLVGMAVSGRPQVPKGSALVVKPRGVIVEQLAARSFNGLLDGAARDAGRETLLKDLIDAIRAAKNDRRISSIFLDTSDMSGAGLTKLDDLRETLLDFRKSGKKVVAYSEAY